MGPKPNTGIKVSIRSPTARLSCRRSTWLVRHVHGAGRHARHRHVRSCSTARAPTRARPGRALDWRRPTARRHRAPVPLWRRPARTAPSRSPGRSATGEHQLAPGPSTATRSTQARVGAEARPYRCSSQLELRELRGLPRAVHDPGHRDVHVDRPAAVVRRVDDGEPCMTSPTTGGDHARFPADVRRGEPEQNRPRPSPAPRQRVSLSLTANTIERQHVSGARSSIVTGAHRGGRTDVGTTASSSSRKRRRRHLHDQVDPRGANTGGITLGLANSQRHDRHDHRQRLGHVVTSTAAGQRAR